MKNTPLFPLLMCGLVASPAFSQTEVNLTYTYFAPSPAPVPECNVTVGDAGATTPLTWNTTTSSYVAGTALNVTVTNRDARTLTVSLADRMMKDKDTNNPEHILVNELRDGTSPITLSEKVNGWAAYAEPVTNLTNLDRLWQADLQDSAFTAGELSSVKLSLLPDMVVGANDQDKRNGKEYEAVFKITCEMTE
jgi:hypothetical protein